MQHSLLMAKLAMMVTCTNDEYSRLRCCTALDTVESKKNSFTPKTAFSLARSVEMHTNFGLPFELSRKPKIYHNILIVSARGLELLTFVFKRLVVLIVFITPPRLVVVLVFMLFVFVWGAALPLSLR